MSSEPEAEVRVPCEVYSRIVGYMTPLQNWNAGKQQEFAYRKTFHPLAGVTPEEPGAEAQQ